MINKERESRSEKPRDSENEAGEQASPAVEPSRKEIGGREGPEPTRFGDWEKNGRCIDF